MSRKHLSPKPRVTSTSDEYTIKAKLRPQEPAPVPPKVKKSKRVKEKVFKEHFHLLYHLVNNHFTFVPLAYTNSTDKN